LAESSTIYSSRSHLAASSETFGYTLVSKRKENMSWRTKRNPEDL